MAYIIRHVVIPPTHKIDISGALIIKVGFCMKSLRFIYQRGKY